jgi:hypothetical protein
MQFVDCKQVVKQTKSAAQASTLQVEKFVLGLEEQEHNVKFFLRFMSHIFGPECGLVTKMYAG